MTGLQLKAEKGLGSPIRKWLRIKGIPVFTLISADGTLLEGFAPRPSSPDIHRFLDGHLGHQRETDISR